MSKLQKVKVVRLNSGSNNEHKKKPARGTPSGLIYFYYLTRDSQARPTKKPVTEMAKTAITPNRVVAVPIAVVISAMI